MDRRCGEHLAVGSDTHHFRRLGEPDTPRVVPGIEAAGADPGFADTQRDLEGPGSRRGEPVAPECPRRGRRWRELLEIGVTDSSARRIQIHHMPTPAHPPYRGCIDRTVRSCPTGVPSCLPSIGRRPDAITPSPACGCDCRQCHATYLDDAPAR